MRRSLSVVQSIGSDNLDRDSDHGPRRRSSGCGGFLEIETKDLSPKVQVAVALSVLAPVILSGLFLLVFAPGFWWIFTTYGWISFSAFGLLARGLAEMASEPSVKQKASIAAESKESELLQALAEHGELSAIQAAMETSLSVEEADGLLRELAEGGHLEVRVRGGGLFYSLWKLEGGDLS